HERPRHAVSDHVEEIPVGRGLARGRADLVDARGEVARSRIEEVARRALAVALVPVAQRAPLLVHHLPGGGIPRLTPRVSYARPPRLAVVGVLIVVVAVGAGIGHANDGEARGAGRGGSGGATRSRRVAR